jgi:hypothetical protein
MEITPMALFDRLANLARGKVKVWRRQRRGEEPADRAVEAELEEAARSVTPPTADRSPASPEKASTPSQEPPPPRDEPPLPKKKRL